MSSEHLLIDTNGIELYLIEQSDLFDLECFDKNKDEPSETICRDMTLDGLRQLAAAILTIVSYYSGEDETASSVPCTYAIRRK